MQYCEVDLYIGFTQNPQPTPPSVSLIGLWLPCLLPTFRSGYSLSKRTFNSNLLLVGPWVPPPTHYTYSFLFPLVGQWLPPPPPPTPSPPSPSPVPYSISFIVLMYRYVLVYVFPIGQGERYRDIWPSCSIFYASKHGYVPFLKRCVLLQCIFIFKCSLCKGPF